MALNNILSPTIICAESIALLHLLHSVPTLPSSNPIDNLPLQQDGYTLSFSRERSLVGTLAFLSNTVDDPNHIPALCVEEDPESSCLNVLLAVNRTNWNDGIQVLQDLKRAFERIFDILSEVSNGDSAQNFEDDIFTEIISMCSLRILFRLRFLVNNRNKLKQPIKKVLQEAISSLEQLGNEKLGKQFLVASFFVERAKHVIKLADIWTKHQTPARLKDLVQGVHRLGQIRGLQALLNTIPNRAMCPSSRRNLLNIVRKVARYQEAARFLYRTAKRFRLVRQAKVVLIDLPKEAFLKIAVDQYTPKLASTIARINAIYRERDLNHICRLIATTEVQANNQFVNQTKKTLREAKIHAEIQLLFFCELNASKRPPRVICSSKDACFLCNAFIRMHGKIHIPRHHGRLYPGWRLPLIPKLKDMEPRFNLVLENKVRNSLTTLLSRNQKTVYPDPNESTLLTLPASVSTLRSLPFSEVVRGKREAVQANPPDGTTAGNSLLVPQRTCGFTMSSENVSSSSSALEWKVSTTEAKDDVNIELSRQISSQLAFQNLCSPRMLLLNNTDNDSGRLIQGRLQSNSVAIDHEPQLFTAGPLEIYIEYMIEKIPTSSKGASKELGYGIEWLPVGEASKLLEHNAASIIDAEALQDETSHELDDQGCLFIAAQGAVVKIFVHSGFG